MKDVIWIGNSREQVRNFPKAARTKLGEALRVAQGGGHHPKAKPLRSMGPGVLEIVAHYDTNTYRVVYPFRCQNPLLQWGCRHRPCGKEHRVIHRKVLKNL